MHTMFLAAPFQLENWIDLTSLAIIILIPFISLIWFDIRRRQGKYSKDVIGIEILGVIVLIVCFILVGVTYYHVITGKYLIGPGF